MNGTIRNERDDRPAVAGLLLAAGGGRRLGGRPKALLRHRGRPLVEHAADALRAGGCDPVHVVLGAAGERVRAEADLTGCVLVDNPGWARGMGSSLRVGLASLAAAPAVDAALVVLVDQPGIGAAAVARIRAAVSPDGRARDALVSASYGGERGHPVLFGAARWPEIARGATGDRGARAYLLAHRESLTLVECGDVANPFDIDTPEDLPRLV
ncbi:NTP transferase domain-containing protein [Streptomyces sp. NPDC058953]|uniref:nucleotidyltransferase family protein n=1 Tax=unclassified Streptomyces TaxID=2593676 RepID=UPI00369FBEEA